MFIATFSIDPDGFALAHALDEAPGTAVEAERIAAHSRHWVMPCLWATGDDIDDFESALAEDPSVDEVIERTRVDDEVFYQVNWSADVKRHVDAALDMEATILNAEVENGEWNLRVRFATRDQFERFREYLREQGLTFRLRNLTESSSPRQEMGGLTAAQRDALVAAVEMGFYDVPRSTTLEAVAGSLGISAQAASERLRRGTSRMVENVLVTHAEARQGT